MGGEVLTWCGDILEDDGPARGGQSPQHIQDAVERQGHHGGAVDFRDDISNHHMFLEECLINAIVCDSEIEVFHSAADGSLWGGDYGFKL